MRTFDHIPTLNEFFKTTGGIPGCEYAIVLTTNLGRAQREGWVKTADSQGVFEISGPSGIAECEMYVSGKPIKGQGFHSGSRKLHIDVGLFDRTGHPDPDAMAQPPAAKPPPKPLGPTPVAAP